MKLADLDKHGLSWNNVLDFCRKNIRYISAGVIGVALVVVLAVTTVNQDKKDKGSKEVNGTDQEGQKGETAKTPADALAKDAVSEINTLMQNYYTAYATGDIDTIGVCAAPVSDTEKSYITMLSQYYAGYENIHVYTGAGVAEGEYVAYVVMEARFEGVETLAPGLDSFYIRRNDSGAYYIDNLYSRFNCDTAEQEQDSQVEAFITSFDNREEVVKLCAEVQTRFDAAMASDATLNAMVTTTLPQAIQAWNPGITPAAPNQTVEGTQPPDPNQPAEGTQPTDPNQPADPTPPADTPNNGVNYIPEGTVIVANKAYIVREGMSTDTKQVASANPGDSVKVILSYQEGWTKVECKGKTGYIRTDLLLNN